MIHMRVSRLNEEGEEVVMTWLEVPQAPMVGELFVLAGNTHIVTKRDWGYHNRTGLCLDAGASAARANTETFCYLRVR